MSSASEELEQMEDLKSVRYWQPLAVILAFSIFLQVAGTLEGFRLETATPGLQPWRLITGQLIHVSWAHLVSNIVGALFIWILVGRAFTLKEWIIVIAISGAIVNIGLINLSRDVAWYAGLSGVLHGLIVAGILVRLHRSDYLGIAMIGGILAKLGFEWYGGGSASMAKLIGAPVISDAHIYGSIAGFLCGIVARFTRLATRTSDEKSGKVARQ
jgi:rhomboid family GlyGly-CTERM serine protease